MKERKGSFIVAPAKVVELLYNVAMCQFKAKHLESFSRGRHYKPALVP